MRYLTLGEILDLYHRVMTQTGGAVGVRDLGALESAIGQPRQSFGGQDLYPSVGAKASALGYSLISNHPFVDGNKRLGHAALETFLVLNGFELDASIDEAEAEILAVAAGQRTRAAFETWVQSHLRSLSPD